MAVAGARRTVTVEVLFAAAAVVRRRDVVDPFADVAAAVPVVFAPFDAAGFLPEARDGVRAVRSRIGRRKRPV